MQEANQYIEVLNAMGSEYKKWTVSPITTGLINHSYIVSDLNGNAHFFLQKINTAVFKDPIAVEENHLLIYQYLKKQAINFSIARPISFLNENYIFIDSQNQYWRFFEYLKDSKTFFQIEKAKEAFEVASVFAQFSQSIQFNPSLLKPTIFDFHNLTLRFQQFEQALYYGLTNRITETTDLIAALKSRKNIVPFFEYIKEHPAEYPLRVQHHDAKISNILFNKNTNHVIGPVDLDTVMPGYFFSDLGDMIRTTATSENEGSSNYDSIHVRTEYYKALIDGYGSVIKETWTKSEWENKHCAGIIMTYMQCLRFLTDYLQGDIYYKIERPQQNLERAKNQYFLLQKLEAHILEQYHYQIPASK